MTNLPEFQDLLAQTFFFFQQSPSSFLSSPVNDAMVHMISNVNPAGHSGYCLLSLALFHITAHTQTYTKPANHGPQQAQYTPV